MTMQYKVHSHHNANRTTKVRFLFVSDDNGALSMQFRDNITSNAKSNVFYGIRFDYVEVSITQVNEIHSWVIIPQLVCSRYCYLMLMPRMGREEKEEGREEPIDLFRRECAVRNGGTDSRHTESRKRVSLFSLFLSLSLLYRSTGW